MTRVYNGGAVSTATAAVPVAAAAVRTTAVPPTTTASVGAAAAAAATPSPFDSNKDYKTYERLLLDLLDHLGESTDGVRFISSVMEELTDWVRISFCLFSGVKTLTCCLCMGVCVSVYCRTCRNRLKM